MMLSRSVSFATFSTGWPVWADSVRLSVSFQRRISFAWISMSVAWPRKPPSGWWISTRECGSARRLPLAPAASRTAPMEAAWPMQIVATSQRMYCMVS